MELRIEPCWKSYRFEATSPRRSSPRDKTMRTSTRTGIALFVAATLSFACQQQANAPGQPSPNPESKLKSEVLFEKTLERHLNAVSNKDIETLGSTLHPDGKMMLILPGLETTYTVVDFLSFHTAWFADPTWTFETQVLETEIGPTLGMAIVEVLYREPERDGEPYFNRMTVSYTLEKTDGAWFFIKDHATSVEKSTDQSE